MEAVPTPWIYGAKCLPQDDGDDIIEASSYWPRLVSRVKSFLESGRSPAGPKGRVDKDLWERDHKVIILDFCSECAF